MKRLILTLSAVLCCATLSAQSESWISLFDGESLKGWEQVGGKATYKVVDGAIVGTTKPNTPNSFLCTERTYGDFILEMEFRVDDDLNSGIQFRSRIIDGIVRGYQYEIDPDTTTPYRGLPANCDAEGRELAAGTAPRAWTGGIYEEKLRGWIGELTHNPEARAAYRAGEWNKMRVEARGALLQTWINNVKAATVVDYRTPSGFIALQVHAINGGRENRQVAWRNIRIIDLGDNPEQGDAIDHYLGEWRDAKTGWLGQIWYDRAEATYKVNLSSKPYANQAPDLTLKGTLQQDGVLAFSNEQGVEGSLAGKRLKVKGENISFNGERIFRVSPTLGAAAPAGAIALYDGNGFEHWGAVAPKEWLTPSRKAEEAVSVTPCGAIEITPGKGAIVTHRQFKDYTMHLEFRLLGEKTNGGVYLQSRYELNIKDSWGIGKGATTGALGNILSPEIAEPAFNYALPPMYWQTLDVEFRAPRFDAEGNKTANARISAWLNGQQIYSEVEVDQLKGAAGRLGEAAEGPIYLQEHGTAYQFRNIWVKEKAGEAKRGGKKDAVANKSSQKSASEAPKSGGSKAPGQRKPANRAKNK